jgi:hypothetical protein
MYEAGDGNKERSQALPGACARVSRQHDAVSLTPAPCSQQGCMRGAQPNAPTRRGHCRRKHLREPLPHRRRGTAACASTSSRLGARSRPAAASGAYEGTGACPTGIGGRLFRRGSRVVTRSFRTRGHACESGTQPVTATGHPNRHFAYHLRGRRELPTSLSHLRPRTESSGVALSRAIAPRRCVPTSSDRGAA